MKTKQLNILSLVACLPKSLLQIVDRKSENRLLKLYIKRYDQLTQLADEFFIKSLYGKTISKKNRNSYSGMKNRLKTKLDQEMPNVQLSQSPLTRQQLLLDYLYPLTDKQCFFSYCMTYIKKLEEQTNKSAEAYQALARWYRQLHYHPELDKFVTQPLYFTKAINYERQCSILLRARDVVEYVGHCTIRNIENTQFPSVDDLLYELRSQEEVIFKVYGEIIDLQQYALDLLKRKAKYFDATRLTYLEQLIFEQHERIADFDFQLIVGKLIQLINMAYERYDYQKNSVKGSQQLMQKIFDLYRLSDEKNLILYCNRISYSRYITITYISLHLNQLEWCKNFHKQYKDHLLGEEKEETIALTNALLSFFNKDYQDTLAAIHQLKLSSVFFKYHFRLLEIHTLYEQLLLRRIESDYVLGRIKAARAYFEREQVMKSSKVKGYINNLDFMDKLIKAIDNPNFNEKDQLKLKKKILDKTPVVSKPALLQRLESVLD